MKSGGVINKAKNIHNGKIKAKRHGTHIKTHKGMWFLGLLKFHKQVVRFKFRLLYLGDRGPEVRRVSKLVWTFERSPVLQPVAY
jgi:hypothetical protein